MLVSVNATARTQRRLILHVRYLLATSRTHLSLARSSPSGNQLPARVMDSIRIEPVRMLPHGSTSLPTATSPRNMSLRLPAIMTELALFPAGEILDARPGSASICVSAPVMALRM